MGQWGELILFLLLVLFFLLSSSFVVVFNVLTRCLFLLLCRLRFLLMVLFWLVRCKSVGGGCCRWSVVGTYRVDGLG